MSKLFRHLISILERLKASTNSLRKFLIVYNERFYKNIKFIELEHELEEKWCENINENILPDMNNFIQSRLNKTFAALINSKM